MSPKEAGDAQAHIDSLTVALLLEERPKGGGSGCRSSYVLRPACRHQGASHSWSIPEVNKGADTALPRLQCYSHSVCV